MSRLYEISLPLLLAAIIAIESSGNPEAVGKAGERGLCQIMEPTWEWLCELYEKDYGWDEAFDPIKNKEMGTLNIGWIRKWLKKHKAKWQSPELDLILAAYNAGPGRVHKADFNVKRVPKSTRAYVQKVKERLNKEK